MKQNYEIEQNGVRVKYNADTIKKGRAVGNPTLRGNFDELTKADILKLLGGEDKLYALAKKTLSTQAHEIFTGCYDNDTKEFDEETWAQLAAGMAVAGETLQDLRDRDAEIAGEVMKLVTSGSITPEVQAKVGELAKESQSVQEAIKKKEAVNEARVAKRKANEEAKKAAANNPKPDAAPVTTT